MLQGQTRRLVLLRHAKAVAKDPAGDFDRALAPRGRSDMVLVAGFLAELFPRPELVLVSPARRTQETLAASGFGDVASRLDPTIYEAETDALLAAIRSVPDDVRSAMLVGHNPGIEELGRLLVGRASGRDGATLGLGLPTAATVVMDIPNLSWRVVGAGSARLVRVVTPADLGGGG